ncbi:cytochrome P450 family protein [Ceratobasidium sp. AG-Ba]|nr:cytochrome P450 family protein [Ceratobasidium sp. AG-Ba]
MSANIAVRIAYGYTANSSNDPFNQRAEEVLAGFLDALTPGKWAVDVLPFLRYIPAWFPFAGFQRRVAYLKNLVTMHEKEPFELVLKQMAEGTAKESFTSKLLQPEVEDNIDDETKEHVKQLSGNLYGAGTDTTFSGIQSFFLAMALYPEVQAKAQAEIAAYIGQKSDTAGETMLLPVDKSNLPYTSALVKEVLRWHPVLNLINHRSSHFDDCNVASNGKIYRIPARSNVFVNFWKILHDPNVYPEPENFVPERYLVKDPSPDPENYVFGFGRRSCPGIHVAQQSMWIAIRLAYRLTLGHRSPTILRSNTLANFTITKSKDAKGRLIVPKEEYVNGFVR